jgi:hypothetical protein
MDVPTGASFFDASAVIRSADVAGSFDGVRGVSAIAIVGGGDQTVFMKQYDSVASR